MAIDDVLIIGQGLAGTALGWACHAAGLSFQVVDRGNAGSASAISAGMMSSVDSLHLERNWRFSELLPRALAFYHEVEVQLDETLIHPLRGWRLLQDEREALEYQRLHGEKGLAPFDQGPLESGVGDRWLKVGHGGFSVSETYRLDVVQYLAASRARWLEDDHLVEAEQMEHDLVIGAKGVEWRGDKYRTVVFCTGAALARKPRLAGALDSAVGEIGELEVESWPERTVVQCGRWFVPIGTNRVAVGSSRRANESNADRGTQGLTRAVNDILRTGWKIDAVRSGMCLAARDHGPVAGLLDASGAIGVLGGLGANGALWSPWLARQWIAWWSSGAAFDRYADVSRLPAEAGRTT
jgi:glycine/D-amino acid oxidase-like deaminating enzyme